MDTELIIFNEYCQRAYRPDFIISLEEGGLIEIRTSTANGIFCLPAPGTGKI